MIQVAPPRALTTRWHRFLEDCKEEARKLGATDPTIYFEGNSGLVVLDGPVHDDRTDRARTEAVVFCLSWPTGGQCDVGGW